MIQNIPTSTIRGMAMGLVELKGTANMIKVNDKPLIGPLSLQECAYYRFVVQVHVKKDRKRYEWENILTGNSSKFPFSLVDSTGKIKVMPQGADISIPVGYSFNTYLKKEIPQHIIALLKSYNLEKYLVRKLSFQEWHIRSGEEVYVIGDAKKTKDFVQEDKDQLFKRISELKKDKEKMAQVDMNKDGNISNEEWDAAVSKIEQEIVAEKMKNTSNDEHEDVMIAGNDVDNIFMISKSSEKELVKSLGIESAAFIVGGPAVSLYTFWSILNYIKIVMGKY